MAIVWALPNPINGGFWLDNPSRSGGVAFNGGEQIVASMAMRWRAKWTVSIRTNDEVLAARAFFDLLQGKANQVLVPAFDGQRAPWPVDFWGRVLSPRMTRHISLEGTIYQSDAIPTASQISAVLVGDVVDLSTDCVIDVNTGSEPRPGQYFGLGVRLYRINAVSETSGSSPVTYDISFLPPSRGGTGHANGNDVYFARSVCLMRQMADDQGIRELEMLKRAELELEFLEDV